MITTLMMMFAMGGPVGGETPLPACIERPDCRFVGSVTIQTDHGVKTPALNRNMPFLRGEAGHERLWMVVGERVVIRVGGAGEPPIIVVEKGAAGDKSKGRTPPKDAVEISFSQMPGSTMMMLNVHNGYDRALTYKAYQLSSKGDERQTSVCGVMPGLVSFESWPGPMVEIELSDFQLADAKSANIICQ